MNIVCRKTECEYNKNYVCQAKGILINNQIICSTFIPTEKQEIDYSDNLLEQIPIYGTHRVINDLNLLCKKNSCLFNRSGNCEANGITINSIAEKPFCVTYLKK
ncbi:MAG: DUF1540 domain-containing protein [Clostridia bacterium]|nr:DUF1540 domain-containing protein [Clostridia bacterium]MDD4686290.1 DUF1540 domain-containing protein [Clostridia bacterium]